MRLNKEYRLLSHMISFKSINFTNAVTMQAQRTVQLYKNAQHCIILYHLRKAVTSYNIHKTDLNELYYDAHISSSTDESTSACEMSTQLNWQFHTQRQRRWSSWSVFASIFQTVCWVIFNLHNQNLIHAVCCSSESMGIS